jgi:hypothetical protein
LDAPGSDFFARTRQRLGKFRYLQYQAKMADVSIWEYTGIAFSHTIMIPFNPGDARRDAMFAERQCTH